MSVIPESHADILDARGIAHLASIGPDGEPQSHPVWYDHEDDEVLISTTTDRQKYRNVERDPRVSASITDPENPYRYLEVRGTITAIEEDSDKRFIDSLAKKYLGADEYPDKTPADDRVVLRLTPEHSAAMG